MTTPHDEATTAPLRDEMLEAHLRRMEGYRPVVLNPTPARRDLPPRNRKHSVRHRALR